MKTLVLVEIGVLLLAFVLRYFYKIYQKHKDKNKVKTVLKYLEHRTGSVEVKKLQKMLGVNDEAKNKSE